MVNTKKESSKHKFNSIQCRNIMGEYGSTCFGGLGLGSGQAGLR